MSKVERLAKSGALFNLELENGKHMFAVGVDGVNNTLIISDGNFNNPSIEKVYHIDLDNETDIEIVRRYIYEEEKLGSLQGNDIAVLYGQGSVSVHKSEDFSNYRESRGEYERKQGERNLGKDSGLQYGKRSNSETKTKYSISEEVPDEGAFVERPAKSGALFN